MAQMMMEHETERTATCANGGMADTGDDRGVLRCLARGRCFSVAELSDASAYGHDLDGGTAIFADARGQAMGIRRGTRVSNEGACRLPIGPRLALPALQDAASAPSRRRPLTDPFDDPESYYRGYVAVPFVAGLAAGPAALQQTRWSAAGDRPPDGQCRLSGGGAAADPSGRPPGGARLDQPSRWPRRGPCRSSCSCSRYRSGFMCWCRPGSASR